MRPDIAKLFASVHPAGRSLRENRSGSLIHPASNGSATDRSRRGRSPHQETAMSIASLNDAHREFTAHLSAVENAARFAFRRRRLKRQDYEDVLAEAIAACWMRLGRPDLPRPGPAGGRRLRHRQLRRPLRPERPADRQPVGRPGGHGCLPSQGSEGPWIPRLQLQRASTRRLTRLTRGCGPTAALRQTRRAFASTTRRGSRPWPRGGGRRPSSWRRVTGRSRWLSKWE